MILRDEIRLALVEQVPIMERRALAQRLNPIMMNSPNGMAETEGNTIVGRSSAARRELWLSR